MTGRLEAMAQAFADHERDHHGAVNAEVPPECLDDVAQRYDQLRAIEQSANDMLDYLPIILGTKPASETQQVEGFARIGRLAYALGRSDP